MAHAKPCGNALRQTFAKEGKALKRKAGGYAHAKQFNRLTHTVKRQRTMALALGHPVGQPLVGKLIREVRNQLNLGAFDLETAPATFPLAGWHTGFHLVNRPALGGNGPRPAASLPVAYGVDQLLKLDTEVIDRPNSQTVIQLEEIGRLGLKAWAGRLSTS